MIEDRYIPEHPKKHGKPPEARYAYYRRCQVFRRGGEQCKAPAEKGSHICYAHAGQLALAVRRERERQAVLAEAVAQMRKRGKRECEAADLFMDFDGIQVMLAVTAKALIDGRIDCKTAGRLLMHLQTMSKLLRMMKTRNSPLINTDDTDLRKLEREEDQNLTAEAQRRGEKQNNLRVINTYDTDLLKAAEELNGTEARRHGEQPNAKKNCAAHEREQTRIALVAEVVAIADRRGRAHAPPELLRVA
ncbi:MAG: hypothetical protein WCG81_06725 [Candidatus Angelobacter sp.]